MATKVYYPLLKPLVFLLACFCLLGCLSGCNNNSAEITREVDKEGTQYQRTGVMSKSEYQRVVALGDKVVNNEANNGKLSEADIDWLLSLSRRSGTAQQKIPRIQWLILVLASGNHDTVPASRRAGVSSFAVQAIQYLGKDAPAVRNACYIFARLGDRRAVPFLTTLLSSGNPDVVRAARQVIHGLSKLPPASQAGSTKIVS